MGIGSLGASNQSARQWGYLSFAYLKKRLDNQDEVRHGQTQAVHQGVLQVSKNLGISDAALHRWTRELGVQGSVTFPRRGKKSLKTEQAEIKRLQRELDIARQERDVLKKVVAFFAKEN